MRVCACFSRCAAAAAAGAPIVAHPMRRAQATLLASRALRWRAPLGAASTEGRSCLSALSPPSPPPQQLGAASSRGHSARSMGALNRPLGAWVSGAASRCLQTESALGRQYRTHECAELGDWVVSEPLRLCRGRLLAIGYSALRCPACHGRVLVTFSACHLRRGKRYRSVGGLRTAGTLERTLLSACCVIAVVVSKS